MATPRESHDNGNDYECQRQDEKDFGQSECHTDMVYQSRPFVLAGRSGLDLVRRAACQNLGGLAQEIEASAAYAHDAGGGATPRQQKTEGLRTAVGRRLRG